MRQHGANCAGLSVLMVRYARLDVAFSREVPALVSAVHGLALAPTCIFTALDEGLAVRYSTKTSCGGFVPLYRNPITRTFGTMASVERRIFFVPTDELKFMLMLQGRSGAV